MYEVVRSHLDCQHGTLLESSVYQGVTIARITAATINDSHAAELEEHLLALAHERHGRLALDCSGLKNFTCAWIRSLLEVTKLCRALNWDFAVFGLKGPARDILRATHLDRRITISRSRTEALDMLGIEKPSSWEGLFTANLALIWPSNRAIPVLSLV